MSSKVVHLQALGLINSPGFLKANLHYEVMMGSVAYGVTSDTSDIDLYGFCIPPKDVVFPHLRGEIDGFGTQKKRFEQYQQHHVVDESAKKEYDLSIYSIVKYFSLCMDNNPNMVDSLFVPTNCVTHITKVGQMVRDNRRMFLHKGYFHRARGFAYSQLNKLTRSGATGKRKDLIDTYGYDVKFAYHVVRLLDQTEQVLLTHDLDLQRSREVLKAVRRGEMTEQQIRDYFQEREKALYALYDTSTLQHSPDEDEIKTLLLECLEEHYGSLDNTIVVPGRERAALEKIVELASKALT